jgi:hypothetical protein
MKKIEEAITPSTRVIVPVHYAGNGCAMDSIMEIGHRDKLYVVEDAAQGVIQNIMVSTSEPLEILELTVSRDEKFHLWRGRSDRYQ